MDGVGCVGAGMMLSWCCHHYGYDYYEVVLRRPIKCDVLSVIWMFRYYGQHCQPRRVQCVTRGWGIRPKQKYSWTWCRRKSVLCTTVGSVLLHNNALATFSWPGHEISEEIFFFGFRKEIDTAWWSTPVILISFMVTSQIFENGKEK